MSPDPLKCGECGGEEFRLYYCPGGKDEGRFGGGGDHTGSVMVRCLKCNEESHIRPNPATLDTNGTLCGGWSR